MLEVEGGEGVMFQEQSPAVSRRWQLVAVVSRLSSFSSLLFLQALGCLGVSDKFVLDALWQVVSLGLHGVQGRRTQGLRSAEPWHLSTDKAHQGQG